MRSPRGLLIAGAALVVPAIGLSTPALAQSSPPVQKGIGIRLVDAPTDRRDDPRAQLYVVDHVRPGASFTRRIELSNGTGSPVTLQLYSAAAEVKGGQFTVVEGRSTNELTAWTVVTPPTVTLADSERAQATVTVAVPPNASEGERYGVVLAELPAKAATPGSVAVASRVGVRMYLSVGPGGEPRSDFVIESLTAGREADGRPVVRATVRNTGGRALDLSGELRLTNGPGSLAAGPFPAKLGTTLALGETEPVIIPLDPSLPAGPWDARIELKSGTTTRAATGRITFPSTPGSAGEPVPASPPESARGPSGLALTGIGTGLLGVLALLYQLWRRRVIDRDEPAPAGPAPQELEELLLALQQADGKAREALVDAAASYGRERLMASARLAELPVETATMLGERVARRR